MLLEIRDVNALADLMSKKLSDLCQAREPHLMMSATLWLESGAEQLMVERYEIAWWLSLSDTGAVDNVKASEYRLVKGRKDPNKEAWRRAEDGEGPDAWLELQEDPAVFDAFDETVLEWVKCAAVGLQCSLAEHYPWPGRRARRKEDES
jgi:hypothetical protein